MQKMWNVLLVWIETGKSALADQAAGTDLEVRRGPQDRQRNVRSGVKATAALLKVLGEDSEGRSSVGKGENTPACRAVVQPGPSVAQPAQRLLPSLTAAAVPPCRSEGSSSKSRRGTESEFRDSIQFR